MQASYATFLRTFVQPNAAFWSYLVSWGELLVGIALLLGLFMGIAALFGSFMNMNCRLVGFG